MVYSEFRNCHFWGSLSFTAGCLVGSHHQDSSTQVTQFLPLDDYSLLQCSQKQALSNGVLGIVILPLLEKFDQVAQSLSLDDKNLIQAREFGLFLVIHSNSKNYDYWRSLTKSLNLFSYDITIYYKDRKNELFLMVSLESQNYHFCCCCELGHQRFARPA